MYEKARKREFNYSFRLYAKTNIQREQYDPIHKQMILINRFFILNLSKAPTNSQVTGLNQSDKLLTE